MQSSRVISAQQVVAGYFGPFQPFLLSEGAQAMLQFNGSTFATIGLGEKAHLNILAPESNHYCAAVSLNGYLVDAAPAAQSQLVAPGGPPPFSRTRRRSGRSAGRTAAQVEWRAGRWLAPRGPDGVFAPAPHRVQAQ